MADMVTTYSERGAEPDEVPRGKALDNLAAGGLWMFFVVDVEPSGTLSIRADVHDMIDATAMRNVLAQILAGLPAD